MDTDLLRQHYQRLLEAAGYQEHKHRRDRRGRWIEKPDMASARQLERLVRAAPPGGPLDAGSKVGYTGGVKKPSQEPAMKAAEVYKLQNDLDWQEQILYDMRSELRNKKIEGDTAEVLEQVKKVAGLQTQVAQAQEAIGGTVFRIPEANVEKAEKKIASFNKRAAKVGTPALTLNVVETEFQPVKKNGKVVGYDKFAYAVFAGPTPKLAGWRFVATIQHTDGGNIVRSVKDEERDLADYWDSSAACDHCGLERRRKDTYVVEHENGERKQIGRMCLQDFLGQDPKAALSWLQFVSTIEGYVGEDESEGGGGGGGPSYFPTEDYMTHVALMVREYGWSPRSAGGTTATDAWDNMLNLISKVHNKQGQPMWVDPEERDVQQAREAIAWIRDFDPGRNDYMHNLKVATGAQFLEYRNVGIAGSLIATWMREKGKEVERQQREKTQKEAAEVSRHVGQVGERLTIEAKVLTHITREGMYGTTHILNFEDKDGNRYSWFASGGSDGADLEPGDEVVMKATVKKHDEFRGVKQTNLTRGKVQQVVAA